MTERQVRRHERLDQLVSGIPSDSLILTKAMISRWLQEHRAEYNSATDTIKACIANFRLHRRHRRMVWAIYSRTDFSHLKGGQNEG